MKHALLVVLLLVLAMTAVPAMAQGFSDGFEGSTIDPWWDTYVLNAPNPVLSTDHAHSGSQSLKLSNVPGGQNYCALLRPFSSPQSGRLSVWLYDTAPGLQTRYATLSGSQGTMSFSMGIMDWVPNNYRVGAGTGGSWAEAWPGPRTQSWHHLECVATENSFEGYFDGAPVLSQAGDYRFDEIWLNVSGPGWRPAATYYFDDFTYTPAPIPITIDTVAVGSPGNTADTTGYGAVGYNYNIGKYEVTAGQYTAFLNAKANVSDPYGLYNSSMLSDTHGCKIQQNSVSGGYTYSVASDYANCPVNYVSYWDSCRFANWLGNGQGTGSTETGAYTLNGYNGSAGRTIGRNAAATWAVTSEDEWYKAAYYKGGGLYSVYANGTNTAPVAGTASNYNNTIGHIWDGTINGALEQNGTKDMMGNVWELTEGLRFQDADYRQFRGGSWAVNTYGYLQSWCRDSYAIPTYEDEGLGFRVSKVVPAYGISNRAAYDPVMSTASTKFNFKVWGKVTNLVSGVSFTVDDGSGTPVNVVAPGFGGIQNGDYASAKGGFSGEGSGRVLNAQASHVVKLH